MLTSISKSILRVEQKWSKGFLPYFVCFFLGIYQSWRRKKETKKYVKTEISQLTWGNRQLPVAHFPNRNIKFNQSCQNQLCQTSGGKKFKEVYSNQVVGSCVAYLLALALCTPQLDGSPKDSSSFSQCGARVPDSGGSRTDLLGKGLYLSVLIYLGAA